MKHVSVFVILTASLAFMHVLNAWLALAGGILTLSISSLMIYMEYSFQLICSSLPWANSSLIQSFKSAIVICCGHKTSSTKFLSIALLRYEYTFAQHR